MGRKPIQRSPQPQGQAAAWQAIRQLNPQGPWTVKQVEYASNLPRKTALDYVKRLLAGGVVERKGTNPETHQVLYAVLVDSIETPRFTRDGRPVYKGKGNDQMWRSMKMIGPFDARELAAASSTEDAIVSPETAASYAKHLHRAGYLVITQEHSHADQRRYRLIPSRNSGPKAPQIQKVKRVYDANLGKVMWEEANDGE